MKNMTAGGATNRNRHSEVAASNRTNSDFNNLMNYFWNYTDMPESFSENLEPHIQVAENDDSVSVAAELPGIDEQDLDLQISADGYLSIRGEKKNSNSSSSYTLNSGELYFPYSSDGFNIYADCSISI